MTLNKNKAILIGLICCLSMTSVQAVERLFWDKVPLAITLSVGKERLVTFPANVRVGIPASLASKLRTQSNQGTVYWKASEDFEAQRIEIHETRSNRIYLVDLKASNKVFSSAPITVLIKDEQEEGGTNANRALNANVGTVKNKVKPPGYAGLTRFAAQQLYAPARLLKSSASIHRIAIAKQTSHYLMRGEQIAATPVVSWQSGSLYVTAVELRNTTSDFITLDPRQIRGRWRTATFHHIRLHPAGTELDTTAVYLVSDRPYHEVI